MRVKCLATGSSGNCHALINKSGDILLLDCGIPIKDIKIGIDFQVSKIVGCLITHAHNDHSLALKDLQKMGIPIVAPYLEEPKINQLKGGFVVRYFGLTDKDGNFVHSNSDGSPCPNYGFYITSDNEPLRMLYITDCQYVKYRFAEIDNMLLGINYSDDTFADDFNEMKKLHVFNGHLELKTAAEFIKVTDCKHTLNNIIVCHMSESNSNEQTFYEAIRKVTQCNIRFAKRGGEYSL